MISDKKLARIAGVFYLVVIVTGLFSEVFVRQALRIPGDAVATAKNINANELLYRFGIVMDLINFVAGIPAVLIIYQLFSATHKLLMRCALVFVITQTCVIAINLLAQVAPLLAISESSSLKSFSSVARAEISLLALEIQAQGYAIGLVFFGCYCLIVGWVIRATNRIPKIFGILYMLVGICYFANSFTMFLSKDFANPIFMYEAPIIFIGELALACWLTFKGVKTTVIIPDAIPQNIL